MAYVQGGLIEAVDFNTFQSQVNNIYAVGNGTAGYGQTTVVVPTVAGGLVELVKSAEWIAMRDAIIACADHQGTARTLLPSAADLAVNAIVYAHDGITDADDIPQMLTDITSNRLVAPAASMTATTGGVKSTQTISTSWSSNANTTIDCVFPSADDARYFFNSGGEIRFSFSRSGGSSTDQNTSWTNFLSSIGTVAMNYGFTANTGVTGTPIAVGYYGLPNSNPQTAIFSATPTGSGAYYAGSTVGITARVLNVSGTNGDNGNTVRFRIDFGDAYTGASDNVDGDLNVFVDEIRATTYLTIPSFTVNLVTPLNAS